MDQLKHEKENIEQEVSQANLRCKELNEVMERINDDLKDARVDRHESSRSQRKAENLDSMKRLFPGVVSRMELSTITVGAVIQFSSNLVDNICCEKLFNIL